MVWRSVLLLPRLLLTVAPDPFHSIVSDRLPCLQ
eukprot:COSAG04_NODE_1063_length_8493_cov_6.486181_5_plen_34_part_00